MRKIIMIPGIILIAAVLLISGSAVAQSWHYIEDYGENANCTNPEEAIGIPDGDFATMGQNGDPNKLGYCVYDLGATGAMGPNQDFTVFASSLVEEWYHVRVSEGSGGNSGTLVGYGLDTQNENFTSPSAPGTYRYIIIEGESGDPGYGDDDIYGPEIDAIGWYG